MADDDRLCYSLALEQWRKSLTRPDLDEEGRVKGALLAYQRQAFVVQMKNDAIRDFDVAQLRHAYEHLSAERVVNQKEFADGLLAPVIERMERKT